jgi:acyl-CoA thioester hydrolase
MSVNNLINTTELRVRFSEVDSMKVVWHGHYVKYIEDGREAFGKQFGISYLDFFSNGLLVPLVHIEVDYKRFLLIGEKAVVETKYVDSRAAKLKFTYTIYNADSGEVIATAKSVQVFLDTNHELLYTTPAFFLEWKKKWGVGC